MMYMCARACVFFNDHCILLQKLNVSYLVGPISSRYICARIHIPIGCDSFIQESWLSICIACHCNFNFVISFLSHSFFFFFLRTR